MKISERPEFKSKKPPVTFEENERVIDAGKGHDSRKLWFSCYYR